MVQLPTLEADQEAPLQPSTEAVTYPRLLGRPGAVGQAVADIGQKVTQQHVQAADVADEGQFATARSAFLIDKANLEANLQDDPDWKTAIVRYQSGMQDAQTAAVGTITNPKYVAEFNKQAGVDVAQGLGAIQHMVHGRQVESDRADLSTLLDANLNTALSTTPENASGLVASSQAAIRAAAAKGTLQASEAVETGQKWVQNYGRSWLALQSPEKQVQILTGRRSGAPGAETMDAAFLGQESGNNPNAPTSVTGAVGPGQVEPATFARFGPPGGNIKNADDNRLAGSNYRAYLSALPNVQGDPSRIAVGYFSGEKNIAPPGSPTPWIKDKADPTGKTTSSYVADILHRLGPGSPTGTGYDPGSTLVQKTGTPADFIPLPERAALAREADRQVRADGAGAAATLANSARDTIEFLHDGGDISKATVTPETVRAAVPGPEGDTLADNLTHAYDYARAAKQISTAPQSQIDGIIAGRMPQGPTDFHASAEEAGSLIKAAQDRNARIYGDGKTPGDPANYVNQNFPDVAQAYAAGTKDPTKFGAYVAKTLGNQTALGIPPEAQRIMPAADAAAIVHGLQTGDPKTALSSLQALQKQAGAYWPQVYGDLGRAGLPASFQALSVAAPQNASTMAAALGQDATSRTTKGAPMAEAMRGVKYDDGSGGAPKGVTDLVEQQLSKDPGLQSLRGSYGVFGRAGATSFDGIYDAVRTTALYLFQTRNMSPSQAATAAASYVTSPFDFVQQPGHAPLRIPQGQSDNFHSAAQTTLDQLSAKDLKPLPAETTARGEEIPGRPESERADQALTHARNAYWIAMPGPDGKGVARAIDPQSDNPIMRANGKPLDISFSQMGAIATTAAKTKAAQSRPRSEIAALTAMGQSVH